MSIFRRRRIRAEHGAVPGQPSPMPCREFVEVVTGYLEGTLSEVDRERFDEHLAACPHCSAYFAQMRTTLRLTGRLTEDDIPDDTREDLLQVFRNWQSA
jgi:predicted anti-sigma-YlaC factor YlaD